MSERDAFIRARWSRSLAPLRGKVSKRALALWLSQHGVGIGRNGIRDWENQKRTASRESVFWTGEVLRTKGSFPTSSGILSLKRAGYFSDVLGLIAVIWTLRPNGVRYAVTLVHMLQYIDSDRSSARNAALSVCSRIVAKLNMEALWTRWLKRRSFRDLPEQLEVACTASSWQNVSPEAAERCAFILALDWTRFYDNTLDRVWRAQLEGFINNQKRLDHLEFRLAFNYFKILRSRDL